MCRWARLTGCACAALLLAGCAGAGAGPTVASVRGGAISRSELAHWIGVAKDLGRDGRPRAQAVLSKLIGFQWIAAEARELGLRVSDAEAGRRLELLGYARTGGLSLGLGPREGELQLLLASAKLTAADRLWLVTLQILATRVKQRLVERAEGAISHARLLAYYRTNEPSFVLPERRDIEVFMVYDRAIAARGKREVLSGKRFSYVAKRLNVAAEADNGLIMGLVRGSGEPPFERHIFRAKLGVLLGPVRQALYYVFRVTRAIPPALRQFSHVEREIRHRLGSREAAGRLLPQLEQSLRAQTACHDGYVVSQCGS